VASVADSAPAEAKRRKTAASMPSGEQLVSLADRL